MVYFVEDNGELLDGFCWLPCEFCGEPSEFLAEAEVCDCRVGFLASDGADKKAVSSWVTAHRLLTTWESSSPRDTGMPFSSLKSFSSVIGAFGGCSLSDDQMVSACIAMKSLLRTCPDTGWYRVCFWMMRLRLAHVISWKTYLPAYSAPYSVPISTFSLRIMISPVSLL